MQQAATYAVAPTGYEFLNPFVGAVGVVLGGALRPRRPMDATTEPDSE